MTARFSAYCARSTGTRVMSGERRAPSQQEERCYLWIKGGCVLHGVAGHLCRRGQPRALAPVPAASPEPAAARALVWGSGRLGSGRYRRGW